jgi:2-polyprenyl-3-methyl-5-hydroxy-6-metoxy-1,4-benzoquinol methylase
MTSALDARARLSGGISHDAIYAAVASELSRADASGRLLDVGCGAGSIWPCLRTRFSDYVGVDGVRYPSFPGRRLLIADLDAPLPLGNATADTVVAIETIEHLENPRGFVRELVRVAVPGGWIVVTTPNQLSALSLLTLVTRQRFNAFQDVHYPAHRTALLEVDLRRIAAECGLEQVRIAYSLAGRMPLTSRHYPVRVARRTPRLLSDTVLLVGRKPVPA